MQQKMKSQEIERWRDRDNLWEQTILARHEKTDYLALICDVVFPKIWVGITKYEEKSLDQS